MSRRSTPTPSCPSDLRRLALRALACAAAALGLAGCGGIVRDYPGVSREALWAAALGVAERPTSYDDWHLVTNGVYPDEAGGRIEIYRELKRDWQPLGQVRRRESETWSLTVQLEPDTTIQALRITQNSTIRHRRFPLEADRFFDEVGLRLAQATAAQGSAAPAAAPPAPRGIQDAGADSLAAPEALEAVRGGGAPAQGLRKDPPAQPVPSAPGSDPQAPSPGAPAPAAPPLEPPGGPEPSPPIEPGTP